MVQNTSQILGDYTNFRDTAFVQEATKQKVTFSNMPQRNKVIEELIDEFVQFRGVLSYKHFIDFRSSNLFLNIHYTIEHLNSIKTLSQPTSPTYAGSVPNVGVGT